MNNLPAYRKTIAAVVGALVTWGSVIVTSSAAQITSSELEELNLEHQRYWVEL